MDNEHLMQGGGPEVGSRDRRQMSGQENQIKPWTIYVEAPHYPRALFVHVEIDDIGL